MTDNEIKKGLECCGSPYNRCLECPLCEMERVKCFTELTANALDLINRLEAENVRVRAKVNHFQYLHDVFTTIPTNRIKTEAVKEFAERLKSNAYTECSITRYKYQVVQIEEIDNLVKEMVGEDT